MKKAVLTLFLLLSLQSCSQKTMITQNPNITADNLVEEIAKQVKHYNYEPIYQFLHGELAKSGYLCLQPKHP